MGYEHLSSRQNNHGQQPQCGSALSLAAAVAVPSTIDSASTVAGTTTYQNNVYYSGTWYGMAALAAFLLCICALLAGLTLAVCGLDMTWLQMRRVTGTVKQRKQAHVVVRMKRRESWMLCSLIVCSVACGESLPIVFQGLWHGHQQWVPILISTLSVAVFAEILPQYLIPRNAIAWGYYCWPVIWGCMWLTAIISYPISRFLDFLPGKVDDRNCCIFTNEELAILLKYHERSKNNGGTLSQDAARVMLGALNLDSRQVGGGTYRTETCINGDETDLEKAHFVMAHGMIVPWSAVKTVSVNESIDNSFIQKLKVWSHSRIPVIGDPQTQLGRDATRQSNWEGITILGFLHTKSLIGLELSTKRDPACPLFVRDLPLYPLLVIYEDMLVYDLLNLFQLGTSRMVVVIPTVQKPSLATGHQDITPCDMTALWAGTGGINDGTMVRVRNSETQVDWTKNVLCAAQTSTRNCEHKPMIKGVRSPKPLGLITFEDVINTILQKTSHDKKDFFDRDPEASAKGKKIGDYSTISCAHGAVRKATGFPVCTDKFQTFFRTSTNRGDLRRGNFSNNGKAPGIMDGPDERGIEGAIGSSIEPLKSRKASAKSSYTQNSRGGFHDIEGSGSSLDHVVELTPEELAEMVNSPSSFETHQDFPSYAISLSSGRCASAIFPARVNPFWRRASVGAVPNLAQLGGVTPFSRENCPRHRRMPLPMAPIFSVQNDSNSTNLHLSGWNSSSTDLKEVLGDRSILAGTGINPREERCESTSLSSKHFGNSENREERHSMLQRADGLNSATPCKTWCNDQHKNNEVLREPHLGYPLKFLGSSNGKENHDLNYVSKTLPRIKSLKTATAALDKDCDSIQLVREESFHDDRAFLPSQRQALNKNANIGGARSSSFWF